MSHDMCKCVAVLSFVRHLKTKRNIQLWTTRQCLISRKWNPSNLYLITFHIQDLTLLNECLPLQKWSWRIFKAVTGFKNYLSLYGKLKRLVFQKKGETHYFLHFVIFFLIEFISFHPICYAKWWPKVLAYWYQRPEFKFWLSFCSFW